MNRSLSALFSALEAVIVAAVGLAIPLAPLTALWAVQYGFGPNWAGFWRLAADAWLLGHGADIRISLGAATLKGVGLTSAAQPFTLTMAILGFSLITILLARRAGRRIAETNRRLLGEIVAVAVFALVSFGVAVSAGDAAARPSVWQGTLLPTLVFLIGLLIARAGAFPTWTGWTADARTLVATALRGGTAAVAAVLVVSALAVGLLLLANYAQMITLYENLHSGALGGLALTIAQLLFLPNLVIWAASWFVGPGFSLGTGSLISPLGTTVGPLPSIPVLGALPQGDLAFGFAGLIVPIIAGFLAGAVLAPSLVAKLRVTPPFTRLAAAGLGMGVVGGVVLGLLAWASAGSIGPGRLQHAGPDPLVVGVFAALEIGVSAVAGMLTTRR